MKTTKKMIFLFLMILSGYASGQYKVTGNVFNEENVPIPYTSVYSAEDSIGTHTDNAGVFHLSVKSLPVRLEFRNVGYKEKVLQVHSSDNLTVQLEERVMLLDEVIVKGDNEKIYVIGSPKRPRGIVFFASESPYQQLALMVRNKNNALYKNAYLEKVSVKIVPPTLGGLKPGGEEQLRLRIYTISDVGRVGDDLLHQNIFLSPSKAGWYAIDFENKIKIPEYGFVIAVEWLKNQEVQKWGKGERASYTYGLLIDGHKLKKEDLTFYSSWEFDPGTQKWFQYKNQDNDEPYGNIPAFRIDLAPL